MAELKPTCVECGEEAVVGWGENHDWLCLAHFEERLRGVKRVVVTAVEELTRETPSV